MSIMSSFSLFVPRVSLDIPRDFVASIFNASVGIVDHIDFVYKMDKNGVAYNAAYVHMKSYFRTRYAQVFRNSLLAQDQDQENGTKLYYNNGADYWIVLKNAAKKHHSFNQGTRKPRLVLDEDMPSKNPPTAAESQVSNSKSLPLPLPLEYVDCEDNIPYFYKVIAPALDGVVRYVMDDDTISADDEYKEAKREMCMFGR